MKRNGFPGSRGERGQVMILASVALTAMLAILALVIDLGYLYAERRSEQRAADAAAWAGALALPIVGEAKARSDALYFAQVNGFTNDATTTVTVNIPPISPPAKQAYDSTYVEVIITRQVETFFAKVLSRFNTSATAYAIAASNQWVNYTLFVIDKTASPALSLGNSTVLHVNGGSIAVNSSAGGSYGAINNNGTLVASNRIDSVGTYTGSGTASPAPTRISVPIADPFATTPRPYYDATYKIYRMPDGTPLVDRSGSYNTANTVNPTSNVTLYPGTYWGGFRLNSSSVTVQLQPGLYVMAGGGSGGGFYANGGTVQGEGVTIYNTSAPEMTSVSDRQPGSVYLGGNAILNLQAPTSGTYAGMLIFQDPSNTQAMTVNGGATSNLIGTVYAPSAALGLGGSGTMTLTLQMVAKTIQVSGNNNMTINMPADRYTPPGTMLVE